MLIAHPVAGKEKSRRICEAFIRGAPRDAQGHVFWGVNETNVDAWLDVQRRGEDWYYGDNAYFDRTRGVRFRWAKNRVQINARDLTSDGRRFDQLELQIKPWRANTSGFWLVIEQSESFMRCVARAPDWLKDTVDELRETHRPVHVRRWDRSKLDAMRSLEADLFDAWTVVVHTSAAAVQAALAGVPVIGHDMHALAGMVCSLDPEIDQRRRFMSVLADYEFDVREIEDGLAWRALHAHE